jgi:hypothetical protein
VARAPISPELVLIDPELARPPDELETVMIDSPNSLDVEPKPSIETLMFNAGLIDADQLGELVRDAVVAQRPVAALALERSLVTPQALDTLLAQTRAAEQPDVQPEAQPATPEQPAVEQAAPAEPVPLQPDPDPEPPLPPAAVAPVLTIPPVHPQPAPAQPAAVVVAAAPNVEVAVAPEPAVEPTPLHAVAPVDEAAPCFEILVRLTNGEAVRAGEATSRDAAEQLGRSTADRFRDAAEWPLVGGRFLRPDLVVSVDVVRRLED